MRSSLACADGPPPRLTPKPPPWRVPYQVRGALVSDLGSQLAEGVIMGDGHQTRGGPVILGGNQDPCVFSGPLGGLHTFCRVVTATMDERSVSH
jgi:hypothetical protein